MKKMLTKWVRQSFAAGCAWALMVVAAPPVLAQTVFETPAVSPGALPGQQATLMGRGFVPGQTITLSYGGQALLETAVNVDDKGGFKATLAIAPQTAPGLYPVVVQALHPTAALVYELKVSPDVPLSGQEAYVSSSQALRAGLYQVAYSTRSNSLFVTSSPANDNNQLFKLDPDTLHVTAQKTLQVAAFGIAVDDVRQTVWVTNTVAVYRQDDLTLVKQFEQGLAPRARDVVVDARQEKAYVSTLNSGLVVLDTTQYVLRPPIAIASTQRGGKFATIGLTLDAQAHKLYAVSLETSEVAVIDTRTDTVENVIQVDGIKGGTGVAVNSSLQRLFVVAQGSDNVALVDLANGKTLSTVAVGASPLNVVFDPVSQHAYVSTRGAGSVTVLDMDGKIVANLPGGRLPNHAAADGKGSVYVVHRSTDASKDDRITRMTPKS